MPVPVISNTTSVLGFRVGEAFEFQPYATESPTSWTSTTLPPGWALDAPTGLISGTVEQAGVYVIGLTATNGTGSSTPHEIAVGVSHGGESDGLGIPLNIDLLTGRAWIPGIEATDGNILFGKRGDQIILDIGFIKDGSLQEIPVTSIYFELREFLNEPTIVLSDPSGNFEQIGSYDRTRFRIVVDLDDSDLSDALAAYGGDYREAFSAIAEIEWSVLYGLPGADPSTAKRSTQTFRMVLESDMVTEASA